MNTLARRIARQGRHRPEVTPARGNVPGPAVNAGHHMGISPGNGAGIQPVYPLIASDGAIFPATGPGSWDQLVTAGRIR